MSHFSSGLSAYGDTDLYIFGAGRGGSLVHAGLTAIGFNKIIAFIDSTKIGFFEDTPIITLSEFAQRHDGRCLVVIASQAFDEISKILETHGITEHVNAYSFISSVIDQERRTGKIDISPDNVNLDLLRIEIEYSCLPRSGISTDEYLRNLSARRDASKFPHVINRAMNHIEHKLGRLELLSYPQYMVVPTTQTCNARCQFCYISDKPASRSLELRLDDFKKMTWLKNIAHLEPWGGYGEPLMSKEFFDIVDFLYELNPLQARSIWTNGQLLHATAAERLVGKLTLINVSINAATKKTYDEIMVNCSWDRLMGNLARFQEINEKYGRPTKLTMSYVANRHNIEELPQLAEIAARFGATSVGVAHFAANGEFPERRDPHFAPEDSLYHHRELSDHYMTIAKAAFEEHGVAFSCPPPFSEPSSIRFGGRSSNVSEEHPDCDSAWRTAFVFFGTGTRWVTACCSMSIDHSHLTEFDTSAEGFMKTWNAPFFRALRDYTRRGSKTDLPWCRVCKNTDKGDPQCIDELWDLAQVSKGVMASLDMIYSPGGWTESTTVKLARQTEESATP